jgi:hypothetical protein
MLGGAPATRESHVRIVMTRSFPVTAPGLPLPGCQFIRRVPATTPRVAATPDTLQR